MGVNALLFWQLGLYRGLWRYASLLDLQRILGTVFIAALAAPALVLILAPAMTVPRSVFATAPLLLAGAMSVSRLLYQAWKEKQLLGVVRYPDASPVIVLGAGAFASSLLRDLASSSQWRAVALLNDDAHKHGGAIHGV